MKIFKTVFGVVVSVVFVGLIIAVIMLNNQSRESDFKVPSYAAEYTLSKMEDGRSLLKARETIVAEFSQSSEKHGITRSLPTQFNSRPLIVGMISVRDEDDIPRIFTTYTEGGRRVVKIGSPNVLVKGKKTYVISYAAYDVTRYAKSADVDEWYWNVNATREGIAIGRTEVTVTIDEAIAPLVKDNPSCYIGQYGSTHRCEIDKVSDTTYRIEKGQMAKNEIITVGFGFPAGTFVNNEPTVFDRYWNFVSATQLYTIPLAIILLLFFAAAYDKRTRRKKDVGFIPPQYIPPQDVSPLVAAEIEGRKLSATTATLIDLAVRHYIALYEKGEEKSPLIPKDYEIKVLKDTSDLPEETQELLRDMFGGHLPSLQETVSLKELRADMSFSKRLADNTAKLSKAMRDTYGLRAKSGQRARFIIWWTIAIFLLAAAFLSIALGILLLIIILSRFGFRPLTDKGVELARYLQGYRTYIRAAEADRLKMLQGPDTAEKVGHAFDPSDPKQLVKLYERSLPYAILFGQEKEWSTRIGELYEKTTEAPSWYPAYSASHLTAAGFSTAIASFDTSSRSFISFASSGSSGSSGGGFSGGGGGGGSIGSW